MNALDELKKVFKFDAKISFLKNDLRPPADRRKIGYVRAQSKLLTGGGRANRLNGTCSSARFARGQHVSKTGASLWAWCSHDFGVIQLDRVFFETLPLAPLSNIFDESDSV